MKLRICNVPVTALVTVEIEVPDVVWDARATDDEAVQAAIIEALTSDDGEESIVFADADEQRLDRAAANKWEFDCEEVT